MKQLNILIIYNERTINFQFKVLLLFNKSTKQTS